MDANISGNDKAVQIEDMTVANLKLSLLKFLEKQGVSFALVCLLAYISFTRMEAMEIKYEMQSKRHHKEVKRFYTDILKRDAATINDCTSAVEENTAVLQDIKELLAKKK